MTVRRHVKSTTRASVVAITAKVRGALNGKHHQMLPDSTNRRSLTPLLSSGIFFSSILNFRNSNKAFSSDASMITGGRRVGQEHISRAASLVVR